MKAQKIRRKHRKLKSKVINTITFIVAMAMFIFIVYYGLSGYTPFIFAAAGCWVWCALYTWANGSFKPVSSRKATK